MYEIKFKKSPDSIRTIKWHRYDYTIGDARKHGTKAIQQEYGWKAYIVSIKALTKKEEERVQHG